MAITRPAHNKNINTPPPSFKNIDSFSDKSIGIANVDLHFNASVLRTASMKHVDVLKGVFRFVPSIIEAGDETYIRRT